MQHDFLFTGSEIVVDLSTEFRLGGGVRSCIRLGALLDRGSNRKTLSYSSIKNMMPFTTNV